MIEIKTEINETETDKNNWEYNNAHLGLLKILIKFMTPHKNNSEKREHKLIISVMKEETSVRSYRHQKTNEVIL